MHVAHTFGAFLMNGREFDFASSACTHDSICDESSSDVEPLLLLQLFDIKTSSEGD